MGWWSCCVMGGDEPYDIRHELNDLIAKSETDAYYLAETEEDTAARYQDLLDVRREHGAKVYTKVSKSGVISDKKRQWYDTDIVRQVCAVEAMEAGIPKDKIKLVLKNAIKAAENDSWASENDERKAYMDDFIKAIKKYDGTPTEVSSEGLFEVLANHIANNEIGLINK